MSISVNNWKLEPSHNALIHCETGETRRLGEFHFILLETLIKHADTVLSRSFLINEVWKNRVVGSNSLPTAIHALRVALDDDGKQQDIIKTIPKKGYIFNKAYIREQQDKVNEFEQSTEENTETNHEILYSETEKTFKKEDNSKKEQHTTIVTAALSKTKTTLEIQENTAVRGTSSPKKFTLTSTSMLALLCILLAMITTFYVVKEKITTTRAVVTNNPITTNVNFPELVDESTDKLPKIKLYHLFRRSVYKRKASPLLLYILPALSRVNNMLVTQNAKMTLYYHMSLQQISLDFLIENSCQHTWQVSLTMANWQEKSEIAGNALYKEVEETLNAMPTCQ